ncbi:hypothetical protein AKJ16_DCAP00131, partial [Drosera capensis]
AYLYRRHHHHQRKSHPPSPTPPLADSRHCRNLISSQLVETRQHIESPVGPLTEDVELSNPKYVQGDNALLAWHGRLASYWRSSPYLMEEKATDDKKELVDIETYLHGATKSKRKWTKESASAFLKLEPGYFPLELVEGKRKSQGQQVRWKQIKDEEDVFRKYEKGPNKDKNNKVRKESDDEDEEKEEEEEGSDASSAGDYSKNEDFDDDEDDCNDDDGGGDGGGRLLLISAWRVSGYGSLHGRSSYDEWTSQ